MCELQLRWGWTGRKDREQDGWETRAGSGLGASPAEAADSCREVVQ
jgi:hypothetical protein